MVEKRYVFDSAFIREMSQNPSSRRIPTLSEISNAFCPARTKASELNEDAYLAMDEAMESEGVYGLIQHAFAMGQGVFPQFMGYAALQGIAQDALIRACVETVADDSTREWVKLTSGNSDGDDDTVKKLTDLMDAFKLRQVFHETMEYVGYEGGALIFIDTGVEPDQLATPLDVTDKSGELRNGGLRGFIVIDPVNVFPGTYNSLFPMKKNYYKPDYWYVMGTRVHKSRVIRVVANEAPTLYKPAYNFFGIPQAQLLWDYVLHFKDARLASSRLLKKFSLLVLKTSLAETGFSENSTAELDAKLRYMVNSMTNDGILAIDQETEDVVKLETPLGGVTDIVRQQLEFIAAINRTPAVKLLGISPSGFNATGESDTRNYYDHIISQCEKCIRPGLTMALRAIQIAKFGEINPSIGFEFNPLGQQDEASIAMTQKTKIDTVIAAVEGSLITQEEGRAILANDPNSGMDIAPELPEDLQDSGEEMPGMAGPGGVDLSDLTGPTDPNVSEE